MTDQDTQARIARHVPLLSVSLCPASLGWRSLLRATSNGDACRCEAPQYASEYLSTRLF